MPLERSPLGFVEGLRRGLELVSVFGLLLFEVLDGPGPHAAEVVAVPGGVVLRLIWDPQLSPTCFYAPALVAKSRRASTANRIARSRSSSGHLPRCCDNAQPDGSEPQWAQVDLAGPDRSGERCRPRCGSMVMLRHLVRCSSRWRRLDEIDDESIAPDGDGWSADGTW